MIDDHPCPASQPPSHPCMHPQVGFFDRARTGELTNRLAEDSRVLRAVATTSVASALGSAAVMVLGLVLM